MITGKDFTDIVFKLIMCNICPPSKQYIKKARKEFKDLRGFNYPQSEEDLAVNIAQVDEAQVGEKKN